MWDPKVVINTTVCRCACVCLKAAHVGVGISGADGLQAACASDYSVAQVHVFITTSSSAYYCHLLLIGSFNFSSLCLDFGASS